MLLWRISNHVSLDGGGGLRASQRWHTRGRPVVYCAPNPATALLEVLVHLEIDLEDLPTHYRFLKIEAPETTTIEQIERTALPSDWVENTSVTRRIGDTWLHSQRSALLAVPCVLVPETYNLLLNPLHPDATQVRIVDVIEYPLDTRLLS